MKVLVTGASGFIGSHLVEGLTKKNYKVECLVRKNSNLQHLKNLDVRLIQGDITDKDSLNFSDIDTVFHLASETGNVTKDRYYLVNYQGTKNLLNKCIESNVRKFIYFSSADIYGRVKKFPITEETKENPWTFYAKSKLLAEKIVLEFCKEKNLHGVIIRPPGVYGPKDHKNSATSLIFKQIKKGYFPLIGDGNNLKEFCYVKNLCEGAILCAEKETKSKIYLISDERPYSFKEIILTIAKVLNINLKIIRLPWFAGYFGGLIFEIILKIMNLPPKFSRETIYKLVNNFYFDISKIKDELGYRPKYSLEEGIKETISNL